MEPKTVAKIALGLEILGVVFLSTFPAWPQSSAVALESSSETAKVLSELREYLFWVGPVLLSVGFWMQYRAITLPSPN